RKPRHGWPSRCTSRWSTRPGAPPIWRPGWRRRMRPGWTVAWTRSAGGSRSSAMPARRRCCAPWHSACSPPALLAALQDLTTRDAAPAEIPGSPTAAGIAGLPSGLLDKLGKLASTVLHVHLDRGTGTWCEENAGVLTKEEAQRIVGHSDVTIRPVPDLAEELTYTGYVAPPRLKEQLALQNSGYCTFPSCHRRARASDVDHQTPAASDGATRSGNTHRLCRKHHRAKDKGGWRVVEPVPGVWVWASPAG